MRIACLLLAAGFSSRMKGANKLLLSFDGESLIRRTVKEIKKSSVDEFIVVTGFDRERVELAIEDLSVRMVFNDNHQIGMHSSIKAGLRALEMKCDAFYVCFGDQPFFSHETLRSLKSSFDKSTQGEILVPTFKGERGHPVLIPSRFISEILEEPDGDYGCSYLFKRHPDLIRFVEVATDSILVDVDDRDAFENALSKSLVALDPTENFYAKILELRQRGETFAIATVIDVIGSASAKTGSKAIFDSHGKNILGWVGGGCAERFVGEQAVQAIQEQNTRIVLADLDDEIFGLGVACGGKMNVFIDPILPAEEMPLPVNTKFKKELRNLCGAYGWKILPNPELEPPQTIEELVVCLSETAARKRGHSGQSLRNIKDVPARFLPSGPLTTKQVTIVGRTRITEALARHFELLSFDVRVIGPGLKVGDYPLSVQCQCLETSFDEIRFRENEIVIIATHTSQDPKLVRLALEAKASHVAMVGSLKRAEEVLQHLNLLDADVYAPLFVPAGLEIGAKNPEEIALSIAAEVIKRGSFIHES